MNPILLAISLGAGFVARAFSGDEEQLKMVMAEAIKHKGYALVDILQPCVSFNKINNYQWYNKRVYKLGKDYNPSDKLQAIETAMEWGDKIPLGIIYHEKKLDFSDKIDFLKKGKPLIENEINADKIKIFMNDFM